jgi:plastocyanin
VSKKRGIPAVSLAVFAVLGGVQAFGLPAGGVTKSQDVPAKARVIVNDNYFEPRSTEVLERGVVRWKWRGENRHNIRFTKVPRGAPRKGASTRSAGRWKRTFRRPGVYRYVCKVWSGMRGTVTVQPEPESER